MLVRLLYAAVFLSVLGAFPRTAYFRAPGGRAPSAAASVSPAWAPRPLPDRYCAAGSEGDIEGDPDFAVPRIHR
jgi:hypothetical protein